MLTRQFTVGGAVHAFDSETFGGYVGVVVGFSQPTVRSQVYVRVEFPGHPWQQPGVSWGFHPSELDRLTPEQAEQWQQPA